MASLIEDKVAELVERLRELCGNCIMAPGNRNQMPLMPACTSCSERHEAADELERLRAALAVIAVQGHVQNCTAPIFAAEVLGNPPTHQLHEIVHKGTRDE